MKPGGAVAGRNNPQSLSGAFAQVNQLLSKLTVSRKPGFIPKGLSNHTFRAFRAANSQKLQYQIPSTRREERKTKNAPNHRWLRAHAFGCMQSEFKNTNQRVLAGLDVF